MHRFGNELDHLGVVFVIWGSAIPSTYLAFRCEPRQRYTYWVLATAFAVASALFTLPTYLPSTHLPAPPFLYVQLARPLNVCLDRSWSVPFRLFPPQSTNVGVELCWARPVKLFGSTSLRC